MPVPGVGPLVSSPDFRLKKDGRLGHGRGQGSLCSSVPSAAAGGIPDLTKIQLDLATQFHLEPPLMVWDKDFDNWLRREQFVKDQFGRRDWLPSNVQSEWLCSFSSDTRVVTIRYYAE